MGQEHVVKAIGQDHVVKAMGQDHEVKAMGQDHVEEAMGQAIVQMKFLIPKFNQNHSNLMCSLYASCPRVLASAISNTVEHSCL